ncbi:hypothetical protein [Chryseosolibacter indicus]|uniref:DUF1640 domain-containing protein n=1 Tax=Chryseosolibacter indicus TaxID=2782351 RepID=A0ABS5VPI4_9BACT|nr:hypothetical protein [Chryseosolibacter indicus]MBT1703348.1 hypothetical protein [Chryseosolibacter indicus]
MENQTTAVEALNELYSYAADLMVNQSKSVDEVQKALIDKGLSTDAAYTIVSKLEDEIIKAKKDAAQKDILYGALWCAGGTIATLANIGFIFWGAILFGGIQFIKGLVNYFSAE